MRVLPLEMRVQPLKCVYIESPSWKWVCSFLLFFGFINFQCFSPHIGFPVQPLIYVEQSFYIPLEEQYKYVGESSTDSDDDEWLLEADKKKKIMKKKKKKKPQGEDICIPVTNPTEFMKRLKKKKLEKKLDRQQKNNHHNNNDSEDDDEDLQQVLRVSRSQAAIDQYKMNRRADGETGGCSSSQAQSEDNNISSTTHDNNDVSVEPRYPRRANTRNVDYSELETPKEDQYLSEYEQKFVLFELKFSG